MSAGEIIAGAAFVKLAADDADLTRGLKKAQDDLHKFAGFVSDWSTKMSAAGLAMSLAFSDVWNSFSKFDTSMRMVKAATGSTASEMADLTAEARRLGRTTTFTTEQVSRMMVQFGRMGFNSAEIKKATGDILALAKATGADLDLALNIAGSTLRVFGKNAEDMSDITDVMVASVNNSAQNLEDFAAAVEKAGPNFSLTGNSIREMAADIGILANMGIRGSVAGTALSTALKRLSNPEVREYLEGMNVRVSDVLGKMYPLHHILTQLAKEMQALSNTERLAMVDKIFGTRGMLAGASLTVNTEAIDQLLKTLGAANGLAKRQQREIEGGVEGATERWVSALNDVKITLGEIMQSAFLPWLENFTKMVNGVGAAFKSLSGINSIFAGVVAPFFSLGIAVKSLQGAASLLHSMYAPIRKLNMVLNSSHSKQSRKENIERGLELGNEFYNKESIRISAAREEAAKAAEVEKANRGSEEARNAYESKKSMRDEQAAKRKQALENAKNRRKAKEAASKEADKSLKHGDNRRYKYYRERAQKLGRQQGAYETNARRYDRQVGAYDEELRPLEENARAMEQNARTATREYNAAKKAADEARTAAQKARESYESIKPGDIEETSVEHFARISPQQAVYHAEMKKLKTGKMPEIQKALQENVQAEIASAQQQRLDIVKRINDEAQKGVNIDQQLMSDLGQSLKQYDEKIEKLNIINEAAKLPVEKTIDINTDALDVAVDGMELPQDVINGVRDYKNEIAGAVKARNALAEAEEKNLTNSERLAAQIVDEVEANEDKIKLTEELSDKVGKVSLEELEAAKAARDWSKNGGKGLEKITLKSKAFAVQLKGLVGLHKIWNGLISFAKNNWIMLGVTAISAISKLVSWLHERALKPLKDDLDAMEKRVERLRGEIDTLKSQNSIDLANLAYLMQFSGSGQLAIGENFERISSLIDDLNSRYEDLGLSIDKTTGKVSVANDAMAKMLQQQKQNADQAQVDFNKAVQRQMDDLQKLLIKSVEDISGVVNKSEEAVLKQLGFTNRVESYYVGPDAKRNRIVWEPGDLFNDITGKSEAQLKELANNLNSIIEGELFGELDKDTQQYVQQMLDVINSILQSKRNDTNAASQVLGLETTIASAEDAEKAMKKLSDAQLKLQEGSRTTLENNLQQIKDEWLDSVKQVENLLNYYKNQRELIVGELERNAGTELEDEYRNRLRAMNEQISATDVLLMKINKAYSSRYTDAKGLRDAEREAIRARRARDPNNNSKLSDAEYMQMAERMLSERSAMVEIENRPYEMFYEQQKALDSKRLDMFLGSFERNGNYIGLVRQLGALIRNEARSLNENHQALAMLTNEAKSLGYFNGTMGSALRGEYDQLFGDLNNLMQEHFQKQADYQGRIMDARAAMSSMSSNESIGSFSAAALSRSLGGTNYQKEISDATKASAAYLREIQKRTGQTADGIRNWNNNTGVM